MTGGAARSHPYPRSVRNVAISAVYFFCLLCGYYLLRPLRDEMAVRTGVENLPWLFTGTFVAMLLVVPLFGWAATRLGTHRLVGAVYGFFILNSLGFYLLLMATRFQEVAAPAFFIWLSVYNLCVVSVFWSFMAEVFSEPGARRYFPRIAAGGSAGAIAGPALAALLARWIEPVHLVLVSVVFQAISIVCVRLLGAGLPPARQVRFTDRPPGMLEGIRLTFRTPLLRGVSLLVICYTTLSTFLYFEQAEILSAAVADSGRRTSYFASIDLSVNVLSIVLQLVGTAPLLLRFGLGTALALVPLLTGMGFGALAAYPVLAVLAVVQVVHRAGNFAVTRPGREVLFTLVDQPTRYQAKNFVDTTVYRASDAVSGWFFSLLRGAGLAAGGVAWIGVAVALFWFATAFRIGRRHDADAHLTT
jgi:AAA family ATP:ADP antiporter